MLNFLAHAKGRGVVLAPFSSEEADPEWLGNLQMESSDAPGPVRSQRIDLGLLARYRARYRARYQSHFELWRSSARRFGIRFARIPSETGFRDALHTVFFSSRRRHTRFDCDWSSDVCSSDLLRQRRLHDAVAAADAQPDCHPARRRQSAVARSLRRRK